MRKSARLGLDPLQTAFVDCWDGSPESTAARVGITPQQAARWQATDWFIDGIRKRTERERSRAIVERIATLQDKIADRVAIQQFWSRVMTNDKERTADQLKASELLAKSLGEFVEKVQLTGDEKNPVCVKQVDLEERIKQLAASGIKVTLDFLE